MTKFLSKLRRNEEGATAIEYGLIAALVAIGLITALGALGGSLQTIFGEASTTLDGNVDATDTGASGSGSGSGS